MDNIKERILNYSIEALQSKGIKELTLKNIAQNCHISRSTFYQYFDSKKALIDEIHEMSDEYDVRTVKEKILNAAMEALSQKNYSDIDIESIAKAVNMQRSSIYRYYPTKGHLFGDCLKIEMENRKKFYECRNIYSVDFRSAIAIFFDYLSEFRTIEYKNVIFFYALSYSQDNEYVKHAFEELWFDTSEILRKVLSHGKDTGELKQDFSEEKYSQMILSYLGGSSIFEYSNFELLKETFINMLYNDLKAHN